MARSLKETKLAKAAYSRWYRSTKDGAAKVRAYGKKTKDERASRNAARAALKKRYGSVALKSKEVHHVSGNPKNNKAKNLRLAKKGHGGGAVGNQNARKKKR
jgi:hypothetical protein